MASIGEQLRSARESKTISLSDAANDVKISKRYLEALEEGNYSVFPAQVYIKGFLSNYAKYLGLDSKNILEQYSKLIIPDSEEIENTIPKKSKGTQRRVSRKRVVMLVIVLVFVIICLISLAYWYSLQLG